MTIDNYVGIAAGIAAVVIGIMVFRSRGKLFRITADTNRAFGDKVGREVARNGSAKWFGAVGVLFTVFGIAAVLMGVFYRE